MFSQNKRRHTHRRLKPGRVQTLAIFCRYLRRAVAEAEYRERELGDRAKETAA